MAQEARACARDLAVLEMAELQVEAILIRCPRAHGGGAHIVQMVPVFLVAFAIVASGQTCAVMGSHQGQDQAPDCSWILEEQVGYIVAVMGETAVADAAEVGIQGLRVCRVVPSVCDKDRRWNLGCCSAVLAVAADRNIPREHHRRTAREQGPAKTEDLGLVRDDTRGSSCVCSPQLAGRSADLLGVVLPQDHERRNVAWLACAYVQA
jgi:hypothetical protein